MVAEFGEEDFVITLTVLSTVLVLFYLGFQVISAPHQKYIATYLVSEEGKALSPDATVLRVGDQLKVQVILENHMGERIMVKLETIVTNNATPLPTSNGTRRFRLQEQALDIDDGGISIAPITFAVTKARIEGNSVVIEEVEVNGVKSPVAIQSPLDNQTLRLIFSVLIWNSSEGRYVPEWNDGLNERSSWLQLWLELQLGSGK
jgi:hypothetical protein